MNLAFLFALSILSAAPPADALSPLAPVNAIVGDAGFVAEHHRAPTAADSEVDRIRAHLRYVIAELRSAPAPFGPAALARRAALLEALTGYAAAGVFPQNHVHPGRRPVFIDADGTLCAVGYLVTEASGREAAEALAARHRYDYVLDMHDDALDAWAAEHGFTLRELAMIQPSYHWQQPVRPTPIPAPIPSPEPPVPSALPTPEAFVILATQAWWSAPDGNVWSMFTRGGQTTILRIDSDRHVTGVATKLGKNRYAWRAYDPSGALLAKGTLLAGEPEGRWTFYRADGSVERVARGSRVGRR